MADLTLSQMLALLPENTTGQISATDLQDVVTALAERTEGTNPLNGVLFDTSPDVPATHTPGHLHWEPTEGTLEIMTGTTDVVLQVGFEQYVDVRNTTGSTILNGRPVRVTGATGNRPLVSLDNGLGTVVGVMTHDLANNGNGKATSFGLVRDIDTSSFSEGAAVYASSTGTLTTAVTSSFVGTVLTSHATQGTLLSNPSKNMNGSGTTAQRPTTVATSFQYLDTTLGKPIFWNGTAWIDATGAAV